jgi:ABC-2 type transport system ATP-binding protein
VAEPSVIDTAALTKHYGNVEAVRGLTLQVPRGSIFGFLGRNGAGKTTTIKMLMGMTRPTSGQARVFGLAADSPEASVEIRQRTGFVGEDKDLYDYMRVDQMIRFTAGFYPRWRRELEKPYLETFELPLHRQIKSLSRGMRTKLALLLVLCRGAELLILDEPTAGLDPAAAESVLQALVGHVAREEMTVFFSSHQLAEVDQIADRVAIIDSGRTLVAGALDSLRERYRRVQLVFDGEAPTVTFRSPGVERVRRQGRVLSVLSSAGDAHVVEEARALNPLAIDVVPVSLKEIFLETIAQELES